MHWRRKWQPTPVLLPGESQGREAWWAALYGVAKIRTRLKRHSSSSCVDETIQPSHLLSAPSPPTLNLSQHQGLFQWVGSLYQLAKILELQLRHQSLQRIFRTDFLWDWLNWSPYSPRNSQESSPTPQFESINSSALSFLYGPNLTSIHDYWRNHSFDYMGLCWQSNVKY